MGIALSLPPPQLRIGTRQTEQGGRIIFIETLTVDSATRFDIVSQVKTVTLAETITNAEKDAICKALKRHKNSGRNGGPDIAAIIAELGITRTTLWRKMKEYGLRTRIVVDVK